MCLYDRGTHEPWCRKWLAEKRVPVTITNKYTQGVPAVTPYCIQLGVMDIKTGGISFDGVFRVRSSLASTVLGRLRRPEFLDIFRRLTMLWRSRRTCGLQRSYLSLASLMLPADDRVACVLVDIQYRVRSEALIRTVGA